MNESQRHIEKYFPIPAWFDRPLDANCEGGVSDSGGAGESCGGRTSATCPWSIVPSSSDPVITSGDHRSRLDNLPT